MTFIQPNKPKSLTTLVLAGLFGMALLGTFWLVVAYNQTVNLSHNIATAKTQLDQIGASNTEASNRLIATMSAGQAATIAREDGLVQDNQPQYVTINNNQQWPIVSR